MIAVLGAAPRIRPYRYASEVGTPRAWALRVADIDAKGALLFSAGDSADE